MISVITINSKQELDEWCDRCRSMWYQDFDPDIVNFPCKVYYCFTESNGYRVIYYLDESLKTEPAIPPLQDPVIWGKGWYAIYDEDEDNWSVAPIDFFDKYEHCPDGWEWEKPEGFTKEEFDEFVEVNGCEPNPPKGFSFCMEMCIQCNDSDLSYEGQEETFINAGYTIKEYTF